jgi:hypothetical protein
MSSMPMSLVPSCVRESPYLISDGTQWHSDVPDSDSSDQWRREADASLTADIHGVERASGVCGFALPV